jgi:6-phosphogluconolactonase
MKPGAGPRHLAFHPGGRFAYLVNELDSTVAVLSYDGAGAFRYLQTVTTLPDGYGGANTCADIQVLPSGTIVYTSNRGHDSIVIHRVDPIAGTLGYVGHASTQGRTPRSFGIEPGGRLLVAANQDSDTIVSFRIDADSGDLTPTGHVASVPTPVCVKFLAAARN